MRYFDNSPFKTNKIKDLFINSDTRNTNNSDEYLSVVRDVGVIKYSERGDSGNKTSDSPEKYKMVDVGDLVINPMNVTIGSVGVSEYSGCLSGVYLVLKPKTSVNSKYYHYLFHDKGFQKYLKTISYGIMEIRESLNKTEFFQFKIPKPPVDEQKKIISYLDKKTTQIDKLIKKIEQKIELLKEQRTSLINEVVTKGLNQNIEMKDSGVEWVGRIPIHWTKSRLDFLYRLYGRVGWKSLKSDEYVNEGYVFLSTPNIKNKDIDYENVNYITEERYYESPEIMLENGDVLLVKDGSTLGIVNIVEDLPRPTTVNSSIGVLKRISDSIMSKFMYYHLSTHYHQNIINRIKGGMGVPHLFQSDIKKFIVLLPPIKEQQEIVEYLDEQTQNIDKTISIEEKKVELLKEYKQSLISEVVTGKKRVV